MESNDHKEAWKYVGVWFDDDRSEFSAVNLILYSSSLHCL